MLGGKAVAPVARGFNAGAELGFRFLSGISDLSVSPSSTSLWIGRSRRWICARWPAHAAALPREPQLLPRQLVEPDHFTQDTTANTREVAMFAYGIAASRLRFGLGVDAPLERYTGPVGLRPFAEYHAEIVTASPDPAFAGYPSDPRTAISTG